MASIDQGIAAEAPRAPSMAPSATLFLALIAALTLVRLIGQHFSAVDIDPDEAQYWEWGRSLAFGYFSKPPLIAWVNWLSDAACGSSIECIRAPAPLFYAGTSILTYAATRLLYGGTAAFWAGIALATAPGVAYSSRIMSTDVPLLFFWALALFAYVRLIKGGGWVWAAVLAAGIGLGLLAKYAMAYFVASVVLGALVDRDARALLKNPRLWAGLVGGVILFLPNVLWNLGNGLKTASATAAYVAPHGAGIHWGDAFTFIIAQFAVFGPVTFATLLSLGVRAPTRSITPTDRLMLLFAWPPLAVVIASGLYSGNAYANWAATGVVAACIVATAVLVRERWWWTLFAGLAFGMLAQAVLLVSDPLAGRLSFPALGPNADIYRYAMGWSALANKVDPLVKTTGAAAVAVEGREDVSELSYYRRNDSQPVFIWTRAATPTNQFEATQALTSSAPEPIVFVSGCNSPARLLDAYAKVVDLGGFVAATGQTTERIYHAFLLSKAKGPLPLLEPCT
jgi:4-amino-4-deoxy-L-arabinose transferase-like glycosyltransferase